jgi:hypothetical protein
MRWRDGSGKGRIKVDDAGGRDEPELHPACLRRHSFHPTVGVPGLCPSREAQRDDIAVDEFLLQRTVHGISQCSPGQCVVWHLTLSFLNDVVRVEKPLSPKLSHTINEEVFDATVFPELDEARELGSRFDPPS